MPDFGLKIDPNGYLEAARRLTLFFFSPNPAGTSLNFETDTKYSQLHRHNNLPMITSKGCFNEKGIKQTHGVVLSQLKFLAQL